MNYPKRTDAERAQIAEKTIGHRMILNTNHGIYAVVRRDGPGRWTLSVACNGISDYCRPFTTKRAAVAAYDELPEAKS